MAESVYIVVQNAGLGEWLTRYLTNIKGALMGPKILMPEEAMHRLVMGFPCVRGMLSTEPEQSGSGNSIQKGSYESLSIPAMKLGLYKALEEALLSDEKIFEPIQNYVGKNSKDRLWPLADTLGGIFHHYAMNCNSLLESWDGDLEITGLSEDQKIHEPWQRRLWQRLFCSQASYTHLGRILSAISQSKDRYDGPKIRIILFGSMFLGEIGLEFFQRLSEDVDVHHFTLSPTSNQSSLNTPFLKNNAVLSSSFDTLVSDMVLTVVEEEWQNPGSSDSTLYCLRTSLIKDSDFPDTPKDDGSLNFHNVVGPRRSVEVLKDRILQAMAEDTSLAPSDIGVLAPDISVYAPYLATIFPSRNHSGYSLNDHLPFNIIDLPQCNEAPLPSCLEALMDLPGSRFGKKTMLKLIENPCFAPVSAKPKLAEYWKSLIEDLYIRWGLDQDHRLSAGAADGRTGSWEYAFERMFLGYCFDEGDNPDVLPWVVSSDSMAEDAGYLMQVIRELGQQLGTLQSRCLSEWIVLWDDLISRWLSPRRSTDGHNSDQGDVLRIKKSFRDIAFLYRELGDLSDFDKNEIPWTVFRSLFNELNAESTARRSHNSSGGITCASLKPTRAIPFRRIYVLGLDEGAWPRREFLMNFDLRKKFSKAIDFSRESIDRLTLLELLFSASDHLSLFYTGRHPERGEAMEPASFVLELMEHLGEGAKKLVRYHPLFSFDPIALTGSGPLASSSKTALALARIRVNPSPIIPPKGRPLPGNKKKELVDWHELARFLKNPVEHFFRRRLDASILGSWMDDNEEDILDADGLQWWKWRNHRIETDLYSLVDAGKTVEDFYHRLKLEGAVSHTPVIACQAEGLSEEARFLSDQIKRIEGEGLDLGEPFICRISDKVQTGTCIDSPSLHLSPTGVEPLSISGIIPGLHYLLESGKPNRQVWTMVNFISGKTPMTTHKLVSWTAVLVLASALEERTPKEIRVFQVGSRDFKAMRYYFRPDEIPPGTGGDKVLLENPWDLLETLVKSFREGEMAPIFLYPELVDHLKKTIAASSSFPEIQSMALEAWKKIVNDTSTPFSTLRDCPWRRQFVQEPDFGTLAFRDIFQDLYGKGGLL